MKFRFIRKVDKKVPVYNGNLVKTGDTIELEGHLAVKAQNNPDFVQARKGKDGGEQAADNKPGADSSGGG